jgi:membrane-bound lytic murein transglycosylase D
MKAFFLSVVSLAFCTTLLSQSTTINVAEKNFDQPSNDLLRVTAPPLPDSFTLFTERVPLEIWDVRERLDKEILTNTYMQGTSMYILKLYTRWMPMIEEELKANNIPDDFKYLCVAESALQNLISKAGATGFWQFMNSAAPGYGLEVNSEVDERYNPRKSTTAACKYLRAAYEKFGSWTAAAASYNCGMGGYNSAATKQGTYNYYNLLLPGETMQYLFRIMALKYILENPKRSGFMIDADDRYYPLQLKQVTVNQPIPDLIQFAKERNTDYKTLKLLNPWLRSNKLTNRHRKTYTLLLPATSSQ